MRSLFRAKGKGKIRISGVDGLVENCLKSYVKRSDHTVCLVTAHELVEPLSQWAIDQLCSGISNVQLSWDRPQ
jgi:hypothetical protein